MTAGPYARDPASSRSASDFLPPAGRDAAFGRRMREAVESTRTLPMSPGSPREPGAMPFQRRPGRRPPARVPWGEPAAEGALVLERYRLLERLGAGGFGVVWRARDELLQREVAVKRIWLGPDGDGDRAAREAHASARLSHPAIVALYEACPVGDAFYLISELVE